MSESLLVTDILDFLRERARGAEHATPRHHLLSYLSANGHSVNDRALRRAYADIPEVGSNAHGLFLIVTADDRKAATRQLHSHSMSELVREKRIKDGGQVGQGSLF